MASIKYLRTAAALLTVGALAFAGGCKKDEEKKADDTTTSAAVEQPATTEAPVVSEEPTPDIPEGFLVAGDKIGVTMPWVGTQNFLEAFERFGPALEAAGFTPTVLEANNKAEAQAQQIEGFINDGVKVIVVGAVDGKSLGPVLEQAVAQGIKVLGYDRLLEDTTAVDGVVQYGAIECGKMEAEALLQGLREKVSPDGPWTIELFAGGPDDPNAVFFFDGAMEVLQPLIDDKTITIGSGQTEFTDVATQGWDNSKAQDRMDALLTANYSDKGPDGVLTPNDGIARAVLTSAENAGFDFPVVDGLDAEDESIQWIKDGKQYATVAKPTDPMINKVVELLNGLLTATELPPGSSTTNNGKIDVQLYELTPTIVTKANVDDPSSW